MYAMLVVQDDDDLAILSLILQRTGLAVITTHDLSKALSMWVERPADILVTAIPEMGVKDINIIRRETVAPLLMLTEPLAEVDHVQLLNAGADMIVQRPFSARLLIAQLRAFLRRAGSGPMITLPILSVPGLTLDPTSRVVRVEGHADCRLTHLEFRLLHTLMINRGQVLPTEAIVDKVWGYGGDGDRDLVRGLISRLRSKIEPDPRHPRFILTEPGIGYLFQPISD